jgi:Ca-activated chloride channel family protein
MSDWTAKDKTNYYAVLGVAEDAALDEIKSAYRHLVRRYHPDTAQDTASAEMFTRIQAAYEVIGDGANRAEYDRWRREQGLVVEPALAMTLMISRPKLPVMLEPQILYVLIEIGTPTKQAKETRMPLSLCLAIDRSTSMQGKRMDQVRLAATHLIDSLGADDLLAVVTFSDRAEVVVPASEKLDKKGARGRVMGIQPSGGTEILSGLVAAMGEVMQIRRRQGVNHIILLTDGRTYGDEAECLGLAHEAGADGIGISAMGIGHDWNDKFLDQLAAQTGGSSAYIDAPEKVGDFLTKRVLGLGATRATDLRLYMHMEPGTILRHAFKLAPFAQELVLPGEGPLMLGALEGSAPLTLVLELQIPPQGDTGYQSFASFDLLATPAGQTRPIDPISKTLRAEVVQNAPDEPPPPAIISALGRLTVHRMQEHATKAADGGDVAGATRNLENLATRLMALGQPELAQAALSEADRLTRTGRLSDEGRKRLKYGTRSLVALPSPKQES